MNFVDFIIIGCLLLGAYSGLRKGVIKSLVQLIGLMTSVIVAYSLKGLLADFLMAKLPFFNFAGPFDGISSINILVYEVLSFVVIFILLYCILNILISISGIIEKILKATVILAIPSKILGAIVGAIEGLTFAFLLVFVLFHVSYASHYVKESYTGVILLERLPFMGQVMAKTTLALEDINTLIADMEKDDKESKAMTDSQVLSTLIHYKIISKESAMELIKNRKIDLPNVTFS